jgi:hypothetical protein
MSRNQIFIIAGSSIVVLLIAILIFLQFIQGNVADPRTNAYYINIEHCPAMEKKEQIDNELAEILSSTKLNENNSFLVPIVSINKKNELSSPAIGMNYIRYILNPVMYVFDNRKEDVELFFKNYAQSNSSYIKLREEALKTTNVEPKVPYEIGNDSTQFFIDLNQNADSDPTKKIWKSLKSLRAHLNTLIVKGRIKAGTKVNVYYLCGPLSGMIGLENEDQDNKDDEESKEATFNNEIKPIIPIDNQVTIAPTNVEIIRLNRINEKNGIEWDIKNIDKNCKIKVDIIEKNTQKIFKSETLSFNVKSLFIPYEKKLNNTNLTVFADIKVIYMDKVLAQKKSDVFTINCKY